MSSSSSSSSPPPSSSLSIDVQITALNARITEVENEINEAASEWKQAASEGEKAYWSKKEEQLRKEKEQLRKKEEQLNDRLNIFLAQQQQQQQAGAIHRKTVSRHGLPALGRGGVGAGSPSSASENKKHANAKLDVLPFKVLKDLELLDEGASIWETDKNEQLLLHTESDIQGFVKQVLGDVIAAAGLSKEIHLANELSVVDLRPDIWLVLQNGVPVGVVEVKKPSEKIMLKPSVFGQIYDYLLQLQSFHGLKTPFGIVTTYLEWRICWLANDRSDVLAACDTVVLAATKAKVPNVVEEELVTAKDFVDADLGEPVAMSNEMRMVHGTDVISFDDENLVKMLASLLHKMTHVELSPVRLLDDARPYIVVNEDSWYWANFSLPTDDVRLSSTTMPNANTKQFWLLKDFRGGVDGRVWLACGKSGRACVIKFSVGGGHDAEKKTALEEELERWKSINNEQRVRVQRIAGSWALVMPYLRHATQADLVNDVTREAIKGEVQRWAVQGYKQRDAALRHVGWMSPVDNNSKCRPVFFDLAHVDRDVTREDAAAHMLKALNLVEAEDDSIE